MSEASSASYPSRLEVLDVGSSFDKEDSPLIRHLLDLRDDSPAIAGLIRDLQLRAGYKMGLAPEDHPLVNLIDISTSGMVSIPHTLVWKQIHGVSNTLAQQVNDAMAHLRGPGGDVHTRVIVLNRSLYKDQRLPPVDVPLHLHIMVVELGISPAEAMSLLRPAMRSARGEHLSALNAAANPSSKHLSLGPKAKSPFVEWDSSAIHVGERDFGDRKLHMVVVCNDGPRYQEFLGDNLDFWSSKFRDNAVHANFRFGAFEDYQLIDWVKSWRVVDLDRYMQANDGGQCPTPEPHSVWINGLVRLIVFRYSIRPSMPQRFHFGTENEVDDAQYELYCRFAAANNQAAKLDLFKIESFIRRYEKSTTQHCASPLETLRVLVEELRAEDEALSAGFQRRSTLRSLDMTKLSIAESKSTIRLTWLATIFIPISLASSIFGMNVREIDSATTPIWYFAVTAVVLLAISAYSWCVMRALHNLKVLFRHADKKRLRRIPPLLFPLLPVGFYWGLYDMTKSHTTAVLHFLGFKRLDDVLS